MFFGNWFTSEVIARIFYNADIQARAEIINSLNLLESNERDRVSVICSEIRRRVNNNPFIRSLSLQAHARDTTQRDALFVFRYKDQVKIGLCEAKYLRINKSNLNDIWDWPISQAKSNFDSHFTKQVKDQQKWIGKAAVWNMFIPDCPVGMYSPSLEKKGSSNIWASELVKHPNISLPNKLWNYQDVLNGSKQYLSMYTIVKEILNCNQGSVTDIINGNVTLSANGKEMEIPIPKRTGTIFNKVNLLFDKFENISSYNYYRFDDLISAVSDYPETGNINVSESIRQKRNFNEFSIEKFSQLLNESLGSDNR